MYVKFEQNSQRIADSLRIHREARNGFIGRFQQMFAGDTLVMFT